MEDTKTQLELPEMETEISEMKNTAEWINNRLDMTKEKVSEFKHTAREIIQSKTQKIKEREREKINKHSISGLWDNFKRPNICIRGISKK